MLGNKTQHTPGPWTVTKGPKSNIIMQAGTPQMVAEVYGYPDDSEANARLIAAAPEMLAFVRQVAANEKWSEGGVSVAYDDQIDNARALLAKLEGK